MKLLYVEVTGFKNLKDNFSLNLMTKAKVADIDLSDEVLRVDENLYVNTSYIFTGKNASGKTTALLLLRIVYKMLHEGILNYDKFAFNRDEITLMFYFYEKGFIYKYMGTLSKPLIELPNESSYVTFTNEVLRRKKYYKSYGRNIFTIPYDVVNTKEGPSSVSILQNSGIKVSGQIVLSTSKNMDLDLAFTIFKNNNYNEKTVNAIIKIFDNAIESMTYSEAKREFTILRGGITQKYNVIEINKVLSEGTIKGIIMFSFALLVLTLGSILLIDEIENSFHKNLIEHLVMLFMDKRINVNGAQLFFSTHYAEVLNVIRRSDAIFILENTGTIDIFNMYTDYEFRSEILKSNIINNNDVNTLISYEDIMKVKRAIIHEISHHD